MLLPNVKYFYVFILKLFLLISVIKPHDFPLFHCYFNKLVKNAFNTLCDAKTPSLLHLCSILHSYFKHSSFHKYLRTKMSWVVSVCGILDLSTQNPVSPAVGCLYVVVLSIYPQAVGFSFYLYMMFLVWSHFYFVFYVI